MKFSSVEPVLSQRVVVIARMTYGDFVLMLPFLAGLRSRHPAARIIVVCGPRGSRLCHISPNVDEVIDVSELKLWNRGLNTLRRILGLLRCDVVYALHPVFSAGVAAFLLRARRRIGFFQASARLFCAEGFQEKQSISRVRAFLLRRVLLTEAIPMQVRESHASMRFPQLLSGTTVPSLRGQLSSAYPRRRSRQPRLILAPFSGWRPKNWRLERWVELAERLAESVHNAEILVSVDSSNVSGARSVFSACTAASIFCPGDDFDLLFRTFATADLIVSNDSFPLHAASAIDVPSVGLFGPTVPAWFGGLSENHADLFRQIECNPCAQRRGMEPCLRGLHTCAALEFWSAETVAARCVEVLDSDR